MNASRLFRVPGQIGLILIILSSNVISPLSAQPGGPAKPAGPFTGQIISPGEFNGDLRELAPASAERVTTGVRPFHYPAGFQPLSGSPAGADPLAQLINGPLPFPSPVDSFEGINYNTGGVGYPPDANGDVDGSYFIQAVNASLAIYNKFTGGQISLVSLNGLFASSPPPCNNQGTGDPVVLYDRLAGRWLVAEMAAPGPFYECIAISKTGDPVSGGWWLYTILISNTYLNDYPKIGVWADAYYMSFNMFTSPEPGTPVGVDVWALNKAQMISGGSLMPVYFSLNNNFFGLLPGNALSTPPAGSPEYYISVNPPNQVLLWQFHADFNAPANSTLNGPTVLNVASFSQAGSVPQPSGAALDSLSFWPMMHLQYRSLNGADTLWFNHTVASNGAAGVRWYEIQNPNSSPAISQQGTYQPDSLNRWMGSVAVDRDGNMALGYSVSSSSLYPSIRYTGRLAGEAPGMLLQAENTLMVGNGSQTGYTRWGDYSSMTVDPTDDCTFWYTTEYYPASGTVWHTRVGSFRFPSCGQPKGTIQGYVRNASNNAPVGGAWVTALSSALAMTVQADGSGHFQFSLPANSYTLTASPYTPGRENGSTITGVALAAGGSISKDISLPQTAYLVQSSIAINDPAPGGNGNQAVEPGEENIHLSVTLLNIGVGSAGNMSAQLVSLTPGITVTTSSAGYPGLQVGASAGNQNPFAFSVNPRFSCGGAIKFNLNLSSGSWNQTVSISLDASVDRARANYFLNTVEYGPAGWTAGGVQNQWGITSADYSSAYHAWTDSTTGAYAANSDSYLASPALNLAGKRSFQLGARYKYALKTNSDYVYLEYSTDGSSSWNPAALAAFNGVLGDWQSRTVSLPGLDGQASAALRYRLVSSSGMALKGILIDDLALSFQPYNCTFTPLAPGIPVMQWPPMNASEGALTTFSWADGGGGGVPTGYILFVDGKPAANFTTPVTSTTMRLAFGAHTWSVTAYNSAGQSPAAPTLPFQTAATGAYLPIVAVK